jgi:hypothetical protein
MASYDPILAPIPIQVRGRGPDDSPWISFLVERAKSRSWCLARRRLRHLLKGIKSNRRKGLFRRIQEQHFMPWMHGTWQLPSPAKVGYLLSLVLGPSLLTLKIDWSNFDQFMPSLGTDMGPFRTNQTGLC